MDRIATRKTPSERVLRLKERYLSSPFEVDVERARHYTAVEKLASLLRAYFELGGRHVQFNPLDRKTLLDAQAHPEKYPDLTVKVSGYSARFMDLCTSLQDDIIGRTEFGEI